MKKTLLGVLLALAPLASGPVGADETLRCGSSVIGIGDRKFEVRRKCGEPVGVAYRIEIRRHRARSGEGAGADEHKHQKWVEVEVEVELWTLNFGPRRLMRVMRFVEGTLSGIETLGYGY